MVLAIRKAFNFEKAPEELNLGRHAYKGFGLVSGDPPKHYILAYPDVISKRIRVAVRIPVSIPEEEVFYIDCVSGLQEASGQLGGMVLGFLSEFERIRTGEKIRW